MMEHSYHQLKKEYNWLKKNLWVNKKLKNYLNQNFQESRVRDQE